MPLLSCVLLCAAAPAPAAAGTITVPGDYARVTDALAAATAGDSVLVGPGTYSTTANGEAFPLFLATAGVTLLGAGSAACTLDAEGANSVVRILAGDGVRVSGFTLTGGNAFSGGGVRVDQGTPEIDHNYICDNAARQFGSGIQLEGGSAAWIHHNVLWQNLDADLGDPGDPHGIQTNGAGGVIEHNLIGRGDSNGLLINTGDEPVVRNNIFFENGTPGVRGRGICHFGGPATVIAHNLFFGNAIAAVLVNTGTFQDLSGSAANGLSPSDGIYGNLDGDPLLADANSKDVSLTGGSPAIDAGDPAGPDDPDGTVPDIGPLFFDQTATGVDDPGPVAARLSVFPNPVRGAATVSVAWTGSGPLMVEIFDVAGRRVGGVDLGHRDAGRYDIALKGLWPRRTPPGVYFVRVSGPGAGPPARIVLLP